MVSGIYLDYLECDNIVILRYITGNFWMRIFIYADYLKCDNVTALIDDISRRIIN